MNLDDAIKRVADSRRYEFDGAWWVETRAEDACAGGGQLVTAAPIAPAGTGQGHNTNYVPDQTGVRRLTPRECERLQGFPDDWTLIDWNGKPSPDSRRYAALGDAVTVNVAHWIATRIVAADNQLTLTEEAA